MSRQCISLLLSTAMLTGLYGTQAEAVSGLTYSLRAEQQVLYTAQLQEYARLDGTEYARSVLMRADGTAVLVGSSSAWLYIP